MQTPPNISRDCDDYVLDYFFEKNHIVLKIEKMKDDGLYINIYIYKYKL